METKVTKWGNSLGVRIPKAVAEQAELEDGSEILLSVRDGEVVIRPKRLTLEALVVQITPENRHAEADFGPARGGEAW
jgi:antitoxin MazE